MPDCDNNYFSACEYSKELIFALINILNIKQFVETGTFLGRTTECIAKNFPHMSIKTVELNQDVFSKTKERLKSYENIEFYLGSSDKFLSSFSQNNLPTLFYLDAHWNNYNPLRDEIKNIEKNSIGKEIIVIDDFYVPNRHFQADRAPEGGLLCMDYIKECLNWDNWIYFYKNKSNTHLPPATGQIYIVHKNLNLPSSFIFMENNIPYSNLSIKIDKIFIIHYKKLVDRKKYMLEQLKKYNLNNFEFVEIDRDELHNYDLSKFTQNMTLKTPAMAIFLSHIHAYKSLNDNFDNILILEDDALFCENFIEKLNLYLGEINENYDMLFLGDGCNLHIPNNQITKNKYIYEKGLEPTYWGGDGCTRCVDSYIMSKKCAKKILDYMENNYYDRTIDWYLNKIARDVNLSVFWAEPTIITQGSDKIFLKSYLE